MRKQPQYLVDQSQPIVVKCVDNDKINQYVDLIGCVIPADQNSKPQTRELHSEWLFLKDDTDESDDIDGFLGVTSDPLVADHTFRGGKSVDEPPDTYHKEEAPMRVYPAGKYELDNNPKFHQHRGLIDEQCTCL